MIAEVVGMPEVDSAIDAVGFEARGHAGGEQPAIVLNQMMDITRAAGDIGIPGLYVTDDPGADGRGCQGRQPFPAISARAGRSRIRCIRGRRRCCATAAL